jgi:uncharacterized membrane protein
MTPTQAVLAVAFLLLMATAGAVWQFGYYGLYGGALAGAIALSFADVKKKGGGSKNG